MYRARRNADSAISQFAKSAVWAVAALFLYRITVSYVTPLALIWTLNIPTQHSSLTLPVLPIWCPQLTQQRCPSAQQFVEVASSEGHFPHRSPPKGRPAQPSSGRILKCVNTDSPFQFTRLSERAALVW